MKFMPGGQAAGLEAQSFVLSVGGVLKMNFDCSDVRTVNVTRRPRS